MKIRFNYFIFSILLVALFFKSSAQDMSYGVVTSIYTPPPKGKRVPATFSPINIGFGFGLNYGGIGGNIAYLINPEFNLFVGVGTAFAGVGINAGAKYKFISHKKKSKSSPFITMMYGYNTAIIITNATQYNKLFYGPSLGGGVDIDFKPAKKGFWSFGLLIPIRGQDVDNYLNSIGAANLSSKLSPITISVGYRLEF